VQVPYTRSQSGLHLLVDSTGIKFLGEGEWKCKKHGVEHRRQWRKLHIGIDAKTLQIRAICVTSNNVSDAAVMPELLQQLPQDEVMHSLTGDGAYDTQSVYEAILKRGAIPIIPPRKNARIRKGQDFVHRKLNSTRKEAKYSTFLQLDQRRSTQKCRVCRVMHSFHVSRTMVLVLSFWPRFFAFAREAPHMEKCYMTLHG
jgi:hypothetical protein